MITPVTDKKVIKLIKSGLSLTGSNKATRIDNWVYNAPLFRNLSFDKHGPTRQAVIMQYLYGACYKDFMKSYKLTKSSFVFDTFRRYKHYAFSYRLLEKTYYFTISYNSERGMDIVFYPHMLPDDFDIQALVDYDCQLYADYARIMYSFLSEFYSCIFNFLFDNYDFYSITQYFERSFSTIDLLKIFEKTRDFNLIMPAI